MSHPDGVAEDLPAVPKAAAVGTRAAMLSALELVRQTEVASKRSVEEEAVEAVEHVVVEAVESQDRETFQYPKCKVAWHGILFS